MIIGYKAFNSDLTNRYGIKFEIGKIYLSTGAIRFGNNGNGFHLCKNIEDTFRYFDTQKMTVCKVIGSGDFAENNSQEDDYYGFSDMYAVEKLQVLKELTRMEIIQEGLKLNEIRAHRFVSLYPLTEEEIILFKERFKDCTSVIDAIAYYQENNKEIYWEKIGVKK